MHWLPFLIMIHMAMSNIIPECPIDCVCFATEIECNKTLPSFIPKNVTSVTVHEVPLEPFMNFTYTDWHSVTNLSLSLGHVVNATSLPQRLLQDYEFVGLMNLQHLKLLCHCRLLTNNKAFYGLTNVSVLDLSNNMMNDRRLDIVLGFMGEDILPNILELFLLNIKVWYDPSQFLFLYLADLHSAMENKPLNVLDLSGTYFVFYVPHSHTPPPSILPQLHTLIISRAGPAIYSMSGVAVFSLSNIYSHYIQRPEAVFSNLQVLDASHPYFPQSLSECDQLYQYYRQFCRTGQLTINNLPFNLTELYIPNIFALQISKLRGKVNSTHLCITVNLFSSNNTICIRASFEHLKKLDISENSFTYIQPELLNALMSLKHLNVSYNKLGPVLSNRNFSRPFFHALKSIEVLIFTNNNITFLQKESLQQNTELKILDLSQNGLTSVKIDLNPHAPLELLDLSYNRITIIDSAGCEILKNLHFSSNTSSTNMSHNNRKTGLKLEGNPLSCSCKNICFFKFLQDQNITLTCYSNGKTHNVSFSFVKQLEYSCKEGIVIAAFTIDGILSIIIISFAIPFIIKDRRKIKFRKLKESGIAQYSTSRKKYVVFLSFSGDDSEFVMTQVYPQLEAGLKHILNTESDCVATGGTHFRPGHAIKEEILRCVEESSVVIFFLSDTFINKSWCRSEVHKAFCDETPIVLMIFGKLNLKTMPKVLRKHYDTFTRVHWSLESGEYVMRPNIEHFCETIVGLIGRGAE